MEESPHQAINVVVRPRLGRDEIPTLADQVHRRLTSGAVAHVYVDVSGVETPDLVHIELLARLYLSARRHDAAVHLIDPCPRLLELLQLVGLNGILSGDGDSPAQLHR